MLACWLHGLTTDTRSQAAVEVVTLASRTAELENDSRRRTRGDTTPAAPSGALTDEEGAGAGVGAGGCGEKTTTMCDATRDAAHDATHEATKFAEIGIGGLAWRTLFERGAVTM
jgi:hypothetical protein